MLQEKNARTASRLDQELTSACDLLRALATPHRLQIVLLLDAGPHCVHELVDELGISQSLVSQHLRILRTTGLVAHARRGKETVYSLPDDHVAHIARDALVHGREPQDLTSSNVIALGTKKEEYLS